MNREKTVFMSIATDVIHGGHIEMIQRAAELGNEDALANVERVREKLNTKKK